MVRTLSSTLAVALVAAACTQQHRAPVSLAPAGPSSRAISLAATLDEKAPLWLAQQGVPSIAIAYIQDGRVQWTRVYGEQARGVPATRETLYNVASLAKPVFAETILRLAAQGRLSLDEPLAAHWVDPDVAGDPRHQRLTTRLALSHQTGFSNWRYQTGNVLKFEREPGTALGYSGEGYEYVRRFAERKLHEPWDSLASRYLFRPLGMTNTAFTRREWFAGRVAIPYSAEGKQLDPMVREFPNPNAADDVYTTIDDFAAFLVGVMNRDGLPAAYAAQRDSIHAVDPKARLTLKCEQSAATRCPRVGMGLGWEIVDDPEESLRMHGGGDFGESTFALYFPETREGAVMLANSGNGWMVTREVIDLLFPDTKLAADIRSSR